MRINYLPLLLPAIVIFFVFLVIPMGVIFYYSLEANPLTGEGEGLSLANYVFFFTRPHYVQTIARTLRISLLATLGSVLLGYIATLILRNVSEKAGSTAILILVFPVLSGSIVTIMGWMVMFTSSGLVGRGIALVRSLIGLPEAKTSILGTDVAVIIGLIHFTLAFVILNLLNVMLKIDRTLEEAAMNLGANRWQVFRRVIFPLSLPGIFSASLIAFSLSMSAYVNPTFLGNRARLVMTTLTSEFMLMFFNWQMASVTSVLLLLLAMFIMVFYYRLYNR
jgi:ABC-type spermidine/putrescine transport system permease subunit I